MKAEDLRSFVGRELEPSAWLTVDQERINAFADATDDHQFIHVSPTLAAKTPFGGTIAHGFLTLSLVPHLTSEIRPDIDDLIMAINYGSDRLRFLQPVHSGSRIRARQSYLEVTEKNPGQWLVKTRVTIEIENEERPALIMESLALLVVK